ncbi:GNAT family N-acetyltransferase [Streptomyces sp. NPDC086796]
MPSDEIVTLSPLRLDDVEAHLTGEDEPLVRWLNGGPGTREGVEAYFRHCWEQWETAGPLRAFGIRVGTDETLAGTIDLRFAGKGLAPGQVNVAYGLYPFWRGHGLATRAVLLASQYAADEGGGGGGDPGGAGEFRIRCGRAAGGIHSRRAAAQQGRPTVRPVHPGPACRSPVTTGNDGDSPLACGHGRRTPQVLARSQPAAPPSTSSRRCPDGHCSSSVRA